MDEAIEEASTYEDAKNKGRIALGYIDCMITYLNCMITMENNDFTGELGELLDSMLASLYQKLANKAIETKQGVEIVLTLLKKETNS